ncbi:MAG: UDP-N-acetylmuramoyl-L-alanine--D-glutamate ligase [Saprospiraceae bacterium]|nr:UDP-N-acetylmuramoyl-L-alanine--D-glutamate ligase [Saprospiraceae bacterium]
MKKIVILGSGESGTGAALLAKRLGYDVLVSDQGPIKDIFKHELDASGIVWEENGHTLKNLLRARLVVKSPGIPDNAPVILALREKGIETIGEIEFAYRHAGPCTIVAITGSNGKTTTTGLIHHLLVHAGLPSRMAGNVGNAFARMVADDLAAGANKDKNRIFVLETSSFQLDDTVKFRPNIAVLLNITPDHLDRYDYTMDKYVESKFRIARNQKRGDLFITNADDAVIKKWLQDHPDAVRCRMDKVRRSDLKNGYVRVGRDQTFDVASTALRGPHNFFNAACAIRVSLRLGVSSMHIEEALFSYAPPEHRMEKVAVINGVTWINDSKATNVDSVYYALQSMDTPTVWIVGGQDKGNDYTPLLPLVRKCVKAIVCMGVDNTKIFQFFKKTKKTILETRSADEAVIAAAKLAESGDTVLLSPACASFDLFQNYEHRGRMFKEAVLKQK